MIQGHFSYSQFPNTSTDTPPTVAGLLCLAVMLDASSREVVGWAIANNLRAELVLDALEMAVGQRRPKDVSHRSEQGSQ